MFYIIAGMLNLALIGVGKWGKNYLRAVQGIRHGQIKYIVSRDSNIIKSLEGTYIHVSDYHDLLQCSDLHGVIIATPSSSHYEIVNFFLEKNIHVLVEKPLTTSYEDAKKLHALFTRRRSIVMVGHIYLHHPAFQKLVSLIPSLGKISKIFMESGNYGPFRTDASALWDWGPHDISMCLAITKKGPKSVTAWGINALGNDAKNADIIFMKLDFDQKITAVIHTGRLFTSKVKRCIVTGSERSILFEDTSEQKLRIYGHNDVCSSSFLKYNIEEPLKNEILDFITRIARQDRNNEDFFIGLKVIKILEAAELSMTHNAKTITI